MKKKIFLLGGFDLEMSEIRNMLEENNIQYFDRSLTWSNAYLKEYAHELDIYGNNEDVNIYGVELQEKGFDSIPSNYFRIDHHNEMSNHPASIIQVAAVLDIPVSHYRQLIAANDSGYIPGMTSMGATPEEINAIRQLDREKQGVTVQDEEMAVKAIENRTIEQGIIVVKSETNRFSPVCDRLFPYEKLMIYTDDELMFYGQGKDRLTVHFDSEIKAGKMFHGGGAEGYFGTAKAVFSVKEIISLKNEIVQLINK